MALSEDVRFIPEANWCLDQLPKKPWDPNAKKLSKVWEELGLLE